MGAGVTVAQATMAIERAAKQARLSLRTKRVWEMKLAGKFFGVGAMVADLPTDQEFLEDYYTTVGPIVYTPTTYRPGVRAYRVLGHEFGHGLGFRTNGARYATEYVFDRAWRSLYELDAAVSQWEVEHFLCGEIPSEETIKRGHRHGYAIDEEFAPFQTTAALQRLILVSDGLYTTAAGRVMIDALKSVGVRERAYDNRAEMEAAE